MSMFGVPVVHAAKNEDVAMWRPLCGAPKTLKTMFAPVDRKRPTCGRCLSALERQKAKAARSNTESSAGRIPRTPGR